MTRTFAPCFLPFIYAELGVGGRPVVVKVVVAGNRALALLIEAVYLQ